MTIPPHGLWVLLRRGSEVATARSGRQHKPCVHDDASTQAVSSTQTRQRGCTTARSGQHHKPCVHDDASTQAVSSTQTRQRGCTTARSGQHQKPCVHDDASTRAVGSTPTRQRGQDDNTNLACMTMPLHRLWVLLRRGSEVRTTTQTLRA